jgi:hypothetical protein
MGCADEALQDGDRELPSSWTYRLNGTVEDRRLLSTEQTLLPASTNLDNPPDQDEKAVLIARMAQSRAKLVVAEPYQDLTMTKEIAGAVGPPW